MVLTPGLMLLIKALQDEMAQISDAIMWDDGNGNSRWKAPTRERTGGIKALMPSRNKLKCKKEKKKGLRCDVNGIF